MTKCPNCGSRKLLLARFRCEACGKTGCKGCLHTVALVHSPDFGGEPADRWRICSADCMGELASRLAPYVAPPALWTANPHRSGSGEDRQFTFSRPFRYRPRTGLSAGRTITVTWLGVVGELHDALREKVKTLAKAGALREYTEDMKAAAYFRRVGLFEESARHFEKWQLFDEALAARRGEEFPLVRNVSVDLAPLIKFVRDEGLSIPFRCKACGSTVRMDAHGRSPGNHRCAHCGSSYDRLEVSDLLATVLR